MNKETFKTIWDKSGLPEYFDMLDHLHGLGFSFNEGAYGDMDFYQSEALNEWLDKNYPDTNFDQVPKEAFTKSAPEILARAEEKREEAKNEN